MKDNLKELKSVFSKMKPNQEQLFRLLAFYKTDKEKAQAILEKINWKNVGSDVITKTIQEYGASLSSKTKTYLFKVLLGRGKRTKQEFERLGKLFKDRSIWMLVLKMKKFSNQQLLTLTLDNTSGFWPMDIITQLRIKSWSLEKTFETEERYGIIGLGQRALEEKKPSFYTVAKLLRKGRIPCDIYSLSYIKRRVPTGKRMSRFLFNLGKDLNSGLAWDYFKENIDLASLSFEEVKLIAKTIGGSPGWGILRDWPGLSSLGRKDLMELLVPFREWTLEKRIVELLGVLNEPPERILEFVEKYSCYRVLRMALEKDLIPKNILYKFARKSENPEMWVIAFGN